MKHYIKLIALLAILFGIFQEGRAQSPCFPNLPVTGAYATGGSSPNKDKVFWLTWGATYAESIGSFPYGKPNVRVYKGSKSYGSIDLGGGKYMCVEAEITYLNVSGTEFQEILTYIPGTYQSNENNGDYLDILYNIGGSGGPNGNPNNKMASGIIPLYTNRTVNIEIKIKATIDSKPVRLRGMVFAEAESLANSYEYIYATGEGNWTVVDVRKNQNTTRTYEISKQTNNYTNPTRSSETILYEKGNDRRTGAVAFLTFKNSAYASLAEGYAVSFSTKFYGKTAFAVGLLTSGYDFGDAPESYGKPIHMIDDISFTSDGIVAGGSTINVNASGYTPGELIRDRIRYLGSTPPDADFDDMYSEDAKGDDNTGPAGPDEEDAWPVMYRQFADKEHYKPGDLITATIPYKEGKPGDKISGWIDFDLNGTFDEGERKTVTIPTGGAGDGSVILEWTVPETRVPYSTYVRLRYFGPADDATRATGTALHGEVEDHRIYILTPGMSNPMLPSKSKQ